MTRIWHPGLQNERTTLAWVRTSLALLGVALVLLKLVTDASAGHTGAIVGGTLLVATIVARLALTRYRVTARSLHGGRPLPDGRLPAVLTATATFVGLTGIVYVAL